MISHIDGATGAVTENSEIVFSAEGQEVLVCPTYNGGKDWEAGVYSQLTNMMYFPLRNTCARMLAVTGADTLPLELYSLAVRNQIAPGTDLVGTVQAISVETGETAWKYDQRAATASLVASGGGLIFGGDANGRFRPWTTRPARYCGRSTSARRLLAFPSPTPSTASSTSRRAPGPRGTRCPSSP